MLYTQEHFDMAHNPYTPPRAVLGMLAPQQPRRYLAVALTFLLALAYAWHFQWHLELVRTGVLALLPLLLISLGLAFSVLAAMMLLFRRNGMIPYVLAALFYLIATVMIWHEPLSALMKHSAYTFGILTAGFGIRACRHTLK